MFRAVRHRRPRRERWRRWRPDLFFAAVRVVVPAFYALEGYAPAGHRGAGRLRGVRPSLALALTRPLGLAGIGLAASAGAAVNLTVLLLVLRWRRGTLARPRDPRFPRASPPRPRSWGSPSKGRDGSLGLEDARGWPGALLVVAVIPGGAVLLGRRGASCGAPEPARAHGHRPEAAGVKLVIQRVSRAEVRVDGKVVGQIGRGFLVLVGAEKGDGAAQADEAASKVAGLRVFEDAAGKMNLALSDVAGSVLAVSQFTLSADLSRGRRPGFERAMPVGGSRAALPDSSAARSSCRRPRSRPGSSAR